MKVLVSGSSGLVGTALCRALQADGHSAVSLVRPGSPARAGDVRWDPTTGELDLAAAEGAAAVVHLAGASIAGGRWNEGRKRVLRDSRVDATRRLVTALGKLKARPAVLVSASAIGYYGDRGDEELTEQSAPGNDFLAQVARDWEAEAFRAEQAGIRTVCLRFGVILAANGGALAKMLPPFRMGVGGRIGSGQQWMSWLTLEDAVGMVRHALDDAKLRGPVNGVAPSPARNADFTRALGQAVHRPTIFPMPAFAARLAFGEMADALLLSSQRVVPERLQAAGYVFRHPNLPGALQAVLHDSRS
jgi:uncharacterized protein (TIGR01777 family)